MRIGSTIQIFGANTNVGKTLTSAGLCAAALAEGCDALYLKPVQTGFPQDSDARTVFRLAVQHRQVHADLHRPIKAAMTAKTLFAWAAPVSPHLAAAAEKNTPADHSIVETLACEIKQFLDPCKSQAEILRTFVCVEGAGGVASPMPSGRAQVDAFRVLRLPAVLVGDPSLGGISTTITAIECLQMRGYDVVALVFCDGALKNHEAVAKHIDSRIPTFVLPETPTEAANKRQQNHGRNPDLARDAELCSNQELTKWMSLARGPCAALFGHICAAQELRLTTLSRMKTQAQNVLWWPFTQHAGLNPSHVNVIDSAFEDFFTVVRDSGAGPSTSSLYDASASWWTQGIGHGHPRLSLALASAAGRYGHVLFPENVHAPALELAELLLSGVGAGWASRVFYSDNGSTAVEVALKMAFRRRVVDLNLGADVTLNVVGLKNSYHGDTLGAMDASSPNVFNETDRWYQPRGLWLDAPQVGCVAGRWQVICATAETEPEVFADRTAIFAKERIQSKTAECYFNKIDKQLDDFLKAARGRVFGALLIEPLVHGSAGMVWIDPLFQKILIRCCRARAIPVIFDEVFTGFWRLGVLSAASFLDEVPDVACFAKGLTGGVVPLAVTLATERIFESFHGEGKRQALLHGHSFTAHPVGCAAALEAQALYLTAPRLEPSFTGATSPQALQRMRDVWCEEAVKQLSCLPGVVRAVGLGTLLAVELNTKTKTKNGESSEAKGYASQGAAEVVAALRAQGILARPLGQVVAVLATCFVSENTVSDLLGILKSVLSEWHEANFE